MSICTDVGSFIESKTTVVQTSNVGFTSEVPDYLVVHTGPEGGGDSCDVVISKVARTKVPEFADRVKAFHVHSEILDTRALPHPRPPCWPSG